MNKRNTKIFYHFNFWLGVFMFLLPIILQIAYRTAPTVGSKLNNENNYLIYKIFKFNVVDSEGAFVYLAFIYLFYFLF